MRKKILFLFVLLFVLSSCSKPKEQINIEKSINEKYEYNVSVGDVVIVKTIAYDKEYNFYEKVNDLSKNGLSLIALNDNPAIDINVESEYEVTIKCLEKFEDSIIIDKLNLSIGNFIYVIPTNVKLNYVEVQPISLAKSLKYYDYDSDLNSLSAFYIINPITLNFTKDDKLELISIYPVFDGASVVSCNGYSKKNSSYVEYDLLAKIEFPYLLEPYSNFILIDLSTSFDYDECGFDLCFEIRINGDTYNVYSHLM